MPLQISKAEDITSAGLARWGLYGENGVGKTTFLRSLCRCEDGKPDPHCVPTLVVSADQENVKPLRGAKHIRVAKLDQWQQLKDVLLFVKSDKCPYKALAFDTWTRLQALAINMVIGYEPKTDEEVLKFIVSAPKIPRGFEAWQQVGALSAEWMRYFMRTPLHVIFLLQEQGKEEDGETKVGPALTRSALVAAKESLELVGRLYVEQEGGSDLNLEETSTKGIDIGTKEVRKLLLGKHPRYFAKGPTHLLGYVVDNPDWPTLAKSLN